MAAGGTVARGGAESGNNTTDIATNGATDNKDDKDGCQSCCSANSKDVSPLLPPKPPTLPPGPYKANMVKPSPGKNPPSRHGFLCSFLVDARGGAMTGHRHWGMRLVIPPNAVNQPTRINCKYQPLNSLAYQPPFMERESLASRVIEISPALQSFRSPVLLEIPHFASNAGGEREIVILRSNDGETWTQHISDAMGDGEIYQDVVSSVVLEDTQLERIYEALEVKRGRVVRVLTSLFPKYFAIVTRIREEVKTLEPEGGRLVLPEDPRCRATFPKNAVHKKIKVGLQVQSICPELVQAAFGRSVDVSKMVAVEPRKRKFHQPIFVSIPVPCNPGKLNQANVRLICSMTGSSDPATWEDMTGSTPLEINNDVVHFSTKVSAIFWLVIIHDQQRDTNSALTLATRLYEESRLVPYMARISVFYRENFPKAWVNTVRIYCMTDDKAEKVVQSLQGFRPLVTSSDVEITEGSEIAVKLGGNILQLSEDPFTRELLPVSTIRTSFVRETFVFSAFQENALTLLIQPKDASKPLEGTFTVYRKLSKISKSQHMLISHLNINPSGEPEMNLDFEEKENVLFYNHEGSQLTSQDIQSRPLPMVLETSYEEEPIKPYPEEDLYEKIEVRTDYKPPLPKSPATKSSQGEGGVTATKAQLQSSDIKSSEAKSKDDKKKKEDQAAKAKEEKARAQLEAKQKKEAEKLRKQEEKNRKKRENEEAKRRKQEENEQAKRRKQEEKEEKKRQKISEIERKKSAKLAPQTPAISVKTTTTNTHVSTPDLRQHHNALSPTDGGAKSADTHKSSHSLNKLSTIFSKKDKSEKVKAKSYNPQDLKDFRQQFSSGQGVVKVEKNTTPPMSPDSKQKNQDKSPRVKAKSYNPQDLKDFRRQFSSGQGVLRVEENTTPPMSPTSKQKHQTQQKEGHESNQQYLTKPTEHIEIQVTNEVDKEQDPSDTKPNNGNAIIKEDISSEGVDSKPESENVDDKVEEIQFEETEDHKEIISDHDSIAKEQQQIITEDSKTNETNDHERTVTEMSVDEEGYRHIPIVIEKQTRQDEAEPLFKNEDIVEEKAVNAHTNEASIGKSYNQDQATNASLVVESKPVETCPEKKKSFIKEWQKDLKEFFSMGDKKGKKVSASSMEGDQDSKSGTKGDNEKKKTLGLATPKSKQKGKKNSNSEAKNLDTDEANSSQNKSMSTESINADQQKSKSKSKGKKISESEDLDVKEIRPEPTLQEIERSKRLQRKQMQESPESPESRKPPMFKSGGKPKVVVPSPKGIPRPEPISRITEAYHRDSMISTESTSDDEFFLQENSNKGRTHSFEESEEFKKAVDSFEEIYRSESGHEITTTCETSTVTTTTSGGVTTTAEKSTKRRSEKSGKKKGGLKARPRSSDSGVLEVSQVKNVDGAPRERKGSNKFAAKKQRNSSRASSGNRNSIGSFEEYEEDSEERISPDLTTRLSETRDQMQRLDDTFRNLVDTEVKQEESETVPILRETKGHSVTRTTVSRTEDPLDHAIETMINKGSSTKEEKVVYEAKISYAYTTEQE